ncbi:MAG TPA: M13 family metallopeptidase [Polyangia bacterium]|jgi:endothelin-converting enzyme/putative endopeptidase|nr:M13 family metallopeptidase [Polyangia bacterium]
MRIRSFFSWPWPCLLAAAALSCSGRSSAPVPPAAAAPAVTGPEAAPKPEPKKDQPLTRLPYTPSLDLAAMDKSANPCVDFFAYACGGWLKNNPIPPDQAGWSVYAKVQDENERYLWGVLNEASQLRSDRRPIDQKIGDYFSSCMDEAAVEKAGVAPIQKLLDEIALLNSRDDLPHLFARLHVTLDDNDLGFGFSSDQDFGNSASVIAFATAGGLGLPDRDYYTKEDPKSQEIRQRYVAHVAEMLRLLGEMPERADTFAAQIMKLETSLARASLTRVEKRDPAKLHHKLTRAQVQALTPSFRWDRYLKVVGVPGVKEINVTEPEFFRQFDAELKNTDLDTWKAYLRWHLGTLMAPYLSTPFVEANFNFYRKYLRGVTAMRPRWKRCVNYVDRDLGEALGQVFVEKTFGPEVKQRTLAMVVEIEKAMQAEIQSLDWMSPATQQKAMEKLRAMVNKIGYPEKWRNYSGLDVQRDDFAGNVLRASEFEARRRLAKIGKPLDRGEWNMTPPTVNAYYNPQMNDMNFPAGVLQPPLFDFKLDDAPNYGDTGGTIGHELIHGFDDEGRHFDARGNLRDWWTPKDAAEFEKRAACVVDQYAQYPIIDDIKINSRLTLGEDLADIGGTLIAYKAWRNATANQRLREVDGFSPDQRFFIGFAQWACGHERDESKRLNAITNPHSPPKYRINGVVANLPEFRDAFQCKAGQPMVKDPVCRVW